MTGLQQMKLDNLLHKKIKFPSSWEELSPIQFISIIDLVNQFTEKNMPLTEFQLRAYLLLTGTDDRQLLKQNYAFMEKNIFCNMKKMNFLYKIIYKDERYKLLSDEMKKKLEKVMPEDINEPESRIACRFIKIITIDLCFARQLLPSIYVGMRQMRGYTFCLSDGLVKTSITAGQYIDAVAALQQYIDTHDDTYITLLVAILYSNPYSADIVADRVAKFTRVPEIVKIGVMSNFQAILTWLTTKTKYKILFSSTSDASNKKKTSPCMNSILYSLVEQGYGDLKDVDNIGLLQFFDLMLKNLVQAAKDMHASKMKMADIADNLHLSIEDLNTII